MGNVGRNLRSAKGFGDIASKVGEPIIPFTTATTAILNSGFKAVELGGIVKFNIAVTKKMLNVELTAKDMISCPGCKGQLYELQSLAVVLSPALLNLRCPKGHLLLVAHNGA